MKERDMAQTMYDIELTFLEPLLGTTPLEEDVYTAFVGGKYEKEGRGPVSDILAEELDSVAVAAAMNDEIEKGTTGFHRLEDGTPMLYDYVIKGFFKDACGMLRRDGESSSSKLTAYKKVIDGMVFIQPRQIPIVVAGELGILERPLRAQTAQGERVALARSETVPVGSSIAFRVLTIGKAVPRTLLEEWLVYGQLRGLGQWRNAGYGRFEYEIAKR
jgi:hypothetical protein